MKNRSSRAAALAPLSLLTALTALAALTVACETGGGGPAPEADARVLTGAGDAGHGGTGGTAGTPDAAPSVPDVAAPPDAAVPDAVAPDAAAPDGSTPDVGLPPGPRELTWGPCPDYIAVTPGFECAFVPLPVDYAEPAGQQLDIFAFRLPAAREAGKKQIWFLQGGPGGSGADFAQLFPYYRERHPEWELYALDHRGVGNSARLSCPQEREPFGLDFTACAASLQETWGEALDGFSTTGAARDLAALIELTRTPGAPVFVYGVSYGTYWGLRYLRLFPDQADGVILDSICSPGHCRLDEYDQNFNENGRLLMDACAGDATCAAKLGTIAPDPWAAVGVVFERAEAGTLCDGDYPFLDRPTLRMLLGWAAMDQTLRQVIPGLIYRLARCDDRDRDVLDYFIDMISGGHGDGFARALPNYEDLDASYTLGTHIIASELLGDLTGAQVQAIADAAYFSTDAAPSMVKVLEQDAWPVYPDDGHHNRFGDTAVPLLMLNGTLDPQTTLAMAQPSGEFYQGPNQTFVAVPDSAHGAIFSSYTHEGLADYLSGSPDYLMETCGFQMMEGFITDPTAAVDQGCLAELARIEFSADSDLDRAMSYSVFGTEDMYEGELNKAGRRSALPPRINPVSGSRRVR